MHVLDTTVLCVDLTPALSDPIIVFSKDRESRTLTSPFEPLPDSKIIASMSVNRYHEICWSYLSHFRRFSISTHASVKLGAIYCFPSWTKLDNVAEIAYIPDCGFEDDGWRVEGERASIMENGWTRCASRILLLDNVLYYLATLKCSFLRCSTDTNF